MNTFMKYALIGTIIVLLLIYRKRIFRAAQPALNQLKDKLAAGEGLSKPLTPMPGTQAERITQMIKDSISKYDVRDLERGTRDWAIVNQSFDRSLMDNLNLGSRPASVNDILSRRVDGERATEKVIWDFGRLVRNQAVINDLWGHPCNCNCGCRQGMGGVAFTFSPN